MYIAFGSGMSLYQMSVIFVFPVFFVVLSISAFQSGNNHGVASRCVPCWFERVLHATTYAGATRAKLSVGRISAPRQRLLALCRKSTCAVTSATVRPANVADAVSLSDFVKYNDTYSGRRDPAAMMQLLLQLPCAKVVPPLFYYMRT